MPEFRAKLATESKLTKLNSRTFLGAKREATKVFAESRIRTLPKSGFVITDDVWLIGSSGLTATNIYGDWVDF